MIFFLLVILAVEGCVGMEHFYCKTKIVSGAGSVAYLKQLQSKRLLLVADPYFEKDGTAERILALSGAQQVERF